MKQQKRILTGDRPTGRLHLGHYVGSLQNRVRLQSDYEQFVIIADVQALTTHFQQPDILKRSVHDLCLDYLAVGIDPEQSHIFVQSMVPQIAELTVIYSMFVMVNTLRHNPTVKTEARQYGYQDLSYGFLGYPVSQAADITFCQADLVPVGNDQLPVVEVTRKIVRRFNALYQPVLTEPETILGACPRLAGLDGNAKMSKSMDNAVYLSDDPATVKEKVRNGRTDTGRIRLHDKGNPSNCTISEYHRIFSPDEYDNICGMCRQATIGCTACKQQLTDNLNHMLDPIRQRRHHYEQQPDYIRDILHHGNQAAIQAGTHTMEQVRHAMQIDYDIR